MFIKLLSVSDKNDLLLQVGDKQMTVQDTDCEEKCLLDGHIFYAQQMSDTQPDEDKYIGKPFVQWVSGNYANREDFLARKECVTFTLYNDEFVYNDSNMWDISLEDLRKGVEMPQLDVK